MLSASTPHYNQLLRYLTGEQKRMVDEHLFNFARGKRGPKHLFVTGPSACGKTALMQLARSLAEKHKVFIRSHNTGTFDLAGMMSVVPAAEAKKHATCEPIFTHRGHVENFGPYQWELVADHVMVQHPCIVVIEEREIPQQVMDIVQFGFDKPCWANCYARFPMIRRKHALPVGAKWKAPIIVVADSATYRSVSALFPDKHWDKLVMPEVPASERDMNLLGKLEMETKSIAARCFASMLRKGGPDQAGSQTGSQASVLASRLNTLRLDVPAAPPAASIVPAAHEEEVEEDPIEAVDEEKEEQHAVKGEFDDLVEKLDMEMKVMASFKTPLKRKARVLSDAAAAANNVEMSEELQAVQESLFVYNAKQAAVRANCEARALEAEKRCAATMEEKARAAEAHLFEMAKLTRALKKMTKEAEEQRRTLTDVYTRISLVLPKTMRPNAAAATEEAALAATLLPKIVDPTRLNGPKQEGPVGQGSQQSQTGQGAQHVPHEEPVGSALRSLSFIPTLSQPFSSIAHQVLFC